MVRELREYPVVFTVKKSDFKKQDSKITSIDFLHFRFSSSENPTSNGPLRVPCPFADAIISNPQDQTIVQNPESIKK